MVPTYRIKDWDLHFEKSDTRKCKNALLWVAVPTRWEGKGFRSLMRFKDGLIAYGCWHLLVQMAAKCPVRGVLEDEDGPITMEAMELMTGVPKSFYDLSIPILIDIGWLISDVHPEASGGIGLSSGGIGTTGQDRTGQDITLLNDSEKTTSTTVPVKRDKATAKDKDNGFAHWYAVYPRKTGRGAALRAFNAALKKTDLQTLIHGAEVYAQSRADEDPKFTKHPATWLNGEHWDDQVEASAGMPGAPPRAEPTEEEMRRLFPEWKCHQ